MDLRQLQNCLLAKPGAVLEFPFDPVTEVYKVGGRMFALLMPDVEPPWLNLKCQPEKAEVLRHLFPAVRPGYHMNKRHWNTVVFDGSVSDQDLLAMIDDSYALVVAGLPHSRRPNGC